MLMPRLMKDKRKRKVRVGVTMGDPSGVGPAVIANALPKLRGLAEFVVIGDRGVFERSFVVRRPSFVGEFIDLQNVPGKNFKFGQIKAEYGRASMEYLDTAMGLISAGRIDCLVTAPISKEAINLAGFKYSGHTEYFAKKCSSAGTVMMLLNRKLKFSLVTRHIALKDVARSLDEAEIYANILAAHKALKAFFGVSRPRICVLGLNPHASDNGIIGKEEAETISPAIIKVRSKLKTVIDGPLPADSAIYKAAQGRYDCLIAMYHDQALIPLKLSGRDSGVNLTLGLPFIRTSPLHGTAFDIAASPKIVDSRPFAAAVKTAVKCASSQKKD